MNRLLLLAVMCPLARADEPLPFKILDYRISAKDEIRLITDGIGLSLDKIAMAVHAKGSATPLATAPLVQTGVRDLQLKLPRELEKGQSYELKLVSGKESKVQTADGEKPGPFTLDPIAISTKATAAIDPSYTAEELGSVFIVKSKIKLKSSSASGRMKLLDYTGRVIDTLKTKATKLLQSAPVNTGWMRVELIDALTQQQVRLQFTGLQNIFDDTVETDRKLIALSPLPKDKTEAFVYLKFLHQAGTGYPAWIVDTKLAPLVGPSFGGGWRMQPSIVADIGNRSVGSTKTNDVIKPSFGISRFFRFEPSKKPEQTTTQDPQLSLIEGIRATPSIAYETNRKGTTGNLIGDVDFQFVIRGLYRPIANARRAKWIADMDTARKQEAAGQTASTDIKMEEITVNWGWGVQFFVGGEFGRAMNEKKVQASKGTAGSPDYEVELLKFNVARLRPKARVFLEFWRASLDTSFTPRRLFTRESYSFESTDGKQVYLGRLSGWASYIESSLALRLDEWGHLAVSSTWKHGIVPPSYVRINTFQSGLEIKF